MSRLPSTLLAAYLAVTAIPGMLAVRGNGSRAAVVLIHLLALIVLALALWGPGRESPARRWVIALAPLAAIPFLYGELPTLMAGLKDGYWDAVVQPWEYALFGGDTPARTLAPALHRALGDMAGTALSEVFFASYLSYYLIIYLPPLRLLAQGKLDLYSRTLIGMMATFLLCYLAFVVFPVEGPRYIWPAPDAMMHGPVRAMVLRLVEAGSSRGAEFPSSHVAVSVAQSIMALRWQRPLGIVASICTVLLSVAVLFAGFHYAVDVIAGAIVGGVIGSLAIRGRGDSVPA